MDRDQSGAVVSREIEMRARNRRLGLILASIAAVFFFGVILKYTLLR